MRLPLILVTLCLPAFLFAQSKKTEKARILVQDGMMLESSMDYSGANKYYLKATKTDPSYSLAWYQFGTGLRKAGTNSRTQIECFTTVIELDSADKNGMKSYKALCDIYYEKGSFDTSYFYFNKYLNHPELHEKRKQAATKEIAQRKFAADSYLHPLKMDPWPLNNAINKEGALQYFPILTGDGRKMLFTRRSKGGQNEDLYLSLFHGDWHEAKKLPGTINGPEAEGTATITADGTAIVCSYCGNLRESYGNCDLYYSRYDGKQWSELKNLGSQINTKSYEAQPTLSPDGKTLYFVSDRPGGEGGLDIWRSTVDLSGNWTQAENLGPIINTSKNEGSPFLHANGQSLFFASKGHIGMGGYDLFLSELEEGKWTEARNLGYPVNDQNNQISLYVSPDWKRGFYSKEEYAEGSINASQSRIWTFDIPNDLKLGHRSNYVKGKVFDNLTKKPIEAELRLVNLETQENTAQVKSSLFNGEYLVMLAEGSEYAFYAETKGYLFKSIAFDYKEKRDFDPITLDIFLDPIIKGVTVQLNNIYFQTGKAVLLNKSKVELEKLYQLMDKNPTLRIELSGHTDNTGSDQINLSISQKRVDSVKKYLVGKGVSSDRIVGKGYGETKPIADNNTAEGRRKNRRVEFTVL